VVPAPDALAAPDVLLAARAALRSAHEADFFFFSLERAQDEGARQAVWGVIACQQGML